jgi:hypothetical protein
MMFNVVVMAPGTQLVLVADRVPVFDPTGGCRRVAEFGAAAGRMSSNCLDDERRAREALEKSYGQFSTADRAHCEILQKTGGQPSYVETITFTRISNQSTIDAS